MAENFCVSDIKSYLRNPDFELVCWFATTHSGPHCHRNFYELVVISSGCGIHTTNGVSCEVSTGDILLLPPGQSHDYSEYDKLELYNLIFSPQMMGYFLPDLTGMIGFQRIFSSSSNPRQHFSNIRIEDEYFHEIFELLKEMSSLRNNTMPGTQMIILSDFIRVVTLISLHSNWSSSDSKNHHIEKISEFLHTLEKTFTEPWDLAQMANSCNMGISNFRRIFRQITSVPPLEYLLRLRLARAIIMLESTDKDLEEIAFNCGFGSANYLSRQFRKNYQITPYRYRKEYQQGQREPFITAKLRR